MKEENGPVASSQDTEQPGSPGGTRPPRRMEVLLEALGGGTALTRDVLGDLAEEYGVRARWGPKAADRWYVREGLRAAPYLVRSAWRARGAHGLAHVAKAVAGAVAALIPFEIVMRHNINAVLVLTRGGSLDDLAPGFGVAASMAAWTFVDGAFAGYVAARIGKRSPLASALLLSAVLAGVMLVTGWNGPSGRFLAVNIASAVMGVLAGGLHGAVHSVDARRDAAGD